MNRYRENINNRERFFGKFAASARCAKNTDQSMDMKADSAAQKTSSIYPSHTHEYLSTTSVEGHGDTLHSHRFAGVTSESIPIEGGGHKHTVFSLTDFHGHIHEVAAETGPEIAVGSGRHVHFISAPTTEADGHTHRVEFSTMINGG